MTEQKTTITTSRAEGHGLQQGDWIQVADFRPWWLRLWHWFVGTPQPARELEVTHVTGTTMTVTPRALRPKPRDFN